MNGKAFCIMSNSTKTVVPSGSVDLAIDPDLIERRRFVRPIPAPEAIERNDDESWSNWNELCAQQDKEAEHAAVVVKLRQMIHGKATGGTAP